MIGKLPSVHKGSWADLAALPSPVPNAEHLLQDHIYRRSNVHFALGDRQRDQLKLPRQIRSRQREIRRCLLASFGGLPLSPKGPPKARLTGTVKGDGFTIEKLLIESRSRVLVTANLYLPNGLKKPTGAVLFLCGHAKEAKAHPEYQVVCQTLVHAGLVVLAQDPIGQGERLSYFEPKSGRNSVEWGVHEHEHAGEQCRLFGDHIGRYFLHDAMRGVDLLCARREVDPRRIGVTGNSGGGTQTSLLMMVDRRLAAAAPATFITSRAAYQETGEAQDAEQIWPGFTANGFDHEDILLSMAPKPVCVLATRRDFFPIAGTMRTVRRAKSAWKCFGKPGALELVVDDAGHSYTPALARAAAGFFQRRLLGMAASSPKMDIRPLARRRLQVTRSGQVRAESGKARFVFEENLARAKLVAESAERKSSAWLRAQVVRHRTGPAPKAKTWLPSTVIRGLRCDFLRWHVCSDLVNVGGLFRRPNVRGRLPLVVAVWEGGLYSAGRHRGWIERQCGEGRAVFVVTLSGEGALAPAAVNSGPARGFFGTWHKLADDLDWIDDSMAALRTYEVISALHLGVLQAGISSKGASVYGVGMVGALGRLASLVDRRITRFEWDEGFSFRICATQRDYRMEGLKPFIVTGLLRHCGLGSSSRTRP